MTAWRASSVPARWRSNRMPALSAFEILGPIMVGPSSSHTAGALRCARVAASLMEGQITRVRFTLHNSFAHTYQGHGTDRALVAGILGFDTDDERIRDAFALARERGLTYAFAIAGDNEHLHPNTVDIEMEDDAGMSCSVRGESLGGGRVRVSRVGGVAVDISGDYDTLFVAHRDTPGVLANLTLLLARYGINIAFMRTYRTERGGNAYTVFELDELPPATLLNELRDADAILTATYVRVPGAAPANIPSSSDEFFETAAQLLERCRRLKMNIGAVMAVREAQLTGETEAVSAMKRVLAVMRAETREPIERPRTSLGGLIGGEAQRVALAAGRYAAALTGAVQTQAIARALAVLERSASMGVIVAAPTAGSAGVVPGCVLAVAEHLGLGDAEAGDALFCAAAIGMLLSSNACVAGAEGGCQAEVGSASAMAAAALVQMLGGSPAQALDAASLALANLLGLVCDPVGGLVEVPCQTRNAIGVANAFSAAQLALSGISSLVPFDEMARTMLEVGRALPASLRETARGGIAQAPSAQAACSSCNACAKHV